MGVSVIINTLNEERNIRACLETVRWADEIIIVDMQSDDRTTAIARAYTDRIFTHPRVGYVDPARNFAMEQATQDWLLILDADERVTPELRAEITRQIQEPTPHNAFKVWVHEYQFGKFIDYSSFRLQRSKRLFRRGHVVWSPLVVHGGAVADGSVGMLNGSIEHFSHLTIGRYLGKLNTYTDIEARAGFESGVRKTLWKAFYRAAGKFVKELVYYRAYKDGGHGWVVAALYAMYYFAADIKLWELWYKHDHGLPLDEAPDLAGKSDSQVTP